MSRGIDQCMTVVFGKKSTVAQFVGSYDVDVMMNFDVGCKIVMC